VQYMESILRVLVVGLLLGAGLPAVFAVGMVAYSHGGGGDNGAGSMAAPNPMLKVVGLVLFLFVLAVILLAILWITRSTLVHHFNFDPFPYMKK
jgi:hypothetical protein